MSNEVLVNIISNTIHEKGIKATHVAAQTGLGYQRLMRILNQRATMTATEMILLSKVLDIPMDAYMEA